MREFMRLIACIPADKLFNPIIRCIPKPNGDGHGNMKENWNIKRWILALIVVCACPWLTGCESTLTGRMWEATENSHREPAGKTNLRLYQTVNHGDVLVRYDEALETGRNLTERAFLLWANEKKLKTGRRPFFLSVDSASKIQSQPLQIISKSDTNAMASEDLQAIIDPDGRHFTIASKGKEIGAFCLPTYGVSTTGDKIKRALLLPATVAADVTIYSTIVGGIVLFYAATSYADDPGGTTGKPHQVEASRSAFDRPAH
ncbi:MAG TPA: hypothetical protein VFC07_00185 [Verrucomicrobiae bacterium]|nr:hypothetical protein [Verrucomicrobiae bacterium]